MGSCLSSAVSAEFPRPRLPRQFQRYLSPDQRLGGWSPLVAVKEVIQRKGFIPVASRYRTSRLLLDDFVVEAKVLGTGLNGTVKLARSKRDRRTYAVKSFTKKGTSAKDRSMLKNEAEIYLSLDHPHIAQLEMVYESKDDLHFVMEHMQGGELFDRLRKFNHFSETQASDATHQMLLAVAYLHSCNIVHRDLKLENFLYERKDTNNLKLIDFGFAKVWDKTRNMSLPCGSLHYIAPEVIAKSYTEKADLWSLGVIVYMLLTGTTPFKDDKEKALLDKIKAGQMRTSGRFSCASQLAQNFVQSLMNVDPHVRLSASMALEHPWIRGMRAATRETPSLHVLGSLRAFTRAPLFRRAMLSMMAWSLSAEDRAGLWEQFLLMDTLKSGTITQTALTNILGNCLSVGTAEAEALFCCLDIDSSDGIDYSEFLAGVLCQKDVHEDVLRRTFTRFDHDASGNISVEDLRNVLGGSFEGATVEDLVREADTSGDGQIDFNEFLAYFRQTTAMVDTRIHKSGYYTAFASI